MLLQRFPILNALIDKSYAWKQICCVPTRCWISCSYETKTYDDTIASNIAQLLDLHTTMDKNIDRCIVFIALFDYLFRNYSFVDRFPGFAGAMRIKLVEFERYYSPILGLTYNPFTLWKSQMHGTIDPVTNRGLLVQRLYQGQDLRCIV